MTLKNKVPQFDDAVADVEMWLVGWQDQDASTGDMVKVPITRNRVNILLRTPLATQIANIALQRKHWFVPCNTNGGGFNVTLNDNPEDGDEVIIKDVAGHCGTSGKEITIIGTVEDQVNPTLNSNFVGVHLVWAATQALWLIIGS